jgi:exonuclease SbcD
MRLLHTSDWHVGRRFHGQDLLADQDAVLAAIAELVTEQRVDVVLVAGDLYDRAVPSAEAVEVCTRALSRIAGAGARIVVTSGNHDSAPRMGALAEFAAAGGLHMRTRISALDEPVLLADGHGTVACYGIPYLEPEPARHALAAPEARGHTGVLTEAMRRVRENLAARDGTRSVVLAHAFVTGGVACDSERTIAVGGVEQVPAEVFSGVDYVALGHLHGAQAITGSVRYSGSPLAYSFSEVNQRKSVWIVDLAADGACETTRHDLPVPRALATATGTLDALLRERRYEKLADCYLSVRLTDPVRPLDPMRKLRERFPHAVHLEWEPQGRDGPEHAGYSDAVRGKDDGEIAADFLSDCRGAGPSSSERAVLTAAIESVHTAEVAR